MNFISLNEIRLKRLHDAVNKTALFFNIQVLGYTNEKQHFKYNDLEFQINTEGCHYGPHYNRTQLETEN